MPAEVLRCDGEKMKRRLRSAAEQGVIVVLRKKLGVEAKAAILAEGSEMQSRSYAGQRLGGPCVIVLGGEGSTRLARTGLEQRP